MAAILDVIRPCIDWIPILLGEKCRELFKKREKPIGHAPLVEIQVVVDEFVDNIVQPTIDGRPNPDLPFDVMSDILTRLPAKCIVDNNVQPIDGPIPDLPFDVMSDILTRLPAQCIFQLWQTKSDDLYALTTTPCFMRTHLDRAPPTIVAQSFNQSSNTDIRLFLFDEKSDNVEATSLKLDLCDAYCKEPIVLCGSYDGFLLFKTLNSYTPVFCIWNPITKEQVILTSPSNILSVCAFYFHPRKKEYEVVCVRNSGAQSHFQILNLRNKHRRRLGSYSYSPDFRRPPVFINGTLYWMVDYFWYLLQNRVYPSFSHSILTLDTETEEFGTMETVIPFSDPSRFHQENFHLFEMEGDLCLFDSSSSLKVVIWIFNFITKCWIKMHSTAVPKGGHHWRFYWYFKEVVYVKKKSEFLAKHWDKRLVNCNLCLGTSKFVEKKGFEGDDFTAVIHTHGLASLQAADSVISLEFDKC